MGSAQSTSCATASASCTARSDKNQVDPVLTAASNKTVTVLDIGHYRVPISKDGGRSIILHDFVGLTVRFGEGSICKIRAEKFKDPAGISVTRPIEDWDTDDVHMKHRAEELEDCGNIRMQDLLAIFEEPSPDYSLMSDNCWSYADATFKQVIRKFLETPSLTPDKRSYLASFLNNPPPVMPDQVLDSVISAVGKGIKVEVPLLPFIAVGTAGVAAGAAAVATPTLATQVATMYTALHCAGFPVTQAALQNGLHAFTAAQAHGPQILHAVLHHAPLILKGAVQTIPATQAVHAPLITHSFLHLVSSKAFIIATSFAKGAACAAPFLWPVAVAVAVAAAGLVTGFVLYKVGTFVMDGTSWGQNIKKRLRVLFSRSPLKQAQGLPSM